MNLSFEVTSGHLQLSSNLGVTLTFGLKLKPTSPAFELTSGLNLRECIFNLTIHPFSQSPYAVKFKEDGRCGEMRSFMAVPTKKDNLYMLWVHVNDDQFNTLYFEASKGNLPIDVDIGVDDNDEAPDGLKEDAYVDHIPGSPQLALRFFLFTLQLVASKENTAG